MILDKPKKVYNIVKSEGMRSFLQSAPRLVKLGVGAAYYDLRAENIFQDDWDVLLILDACRPDALEEVAEDYSFLPNSIPTKISVGGNSPRWMQKTFRTEYKEKISNSVYISGNPHTERLLGTETDGLYSDLADEIDWLAVLSDHISVWKEQWDHDNGTVLARSVTDRVVDYKRQYRDERIIAHYMQPHFPSVPSDLDSGLDIENDATWDRNIWQELGEGELEVETAWNAYIENLRYVLDDIVLLLENLDSERVVITADHGNAFGEKGEWGHGQSSTASVRRVPWVEVSATDTYKYEPEMRQVQESASVNEKLEALGYKAY